MSASYGCERLAHLTSAHDFDASNDDEAPLQEGACACQRLATCGCSHVEGASDGRCGKMLSRSSKPGLVEQLPCGVNGGLTRRPAHTRKAAAAPRYTDLIVGGLRSRQCCSRCRNRSYVHKTSKLYREAVTCHARPLLLNVVERYGVSATVTACRDLHCFNLLPQPSQTGCYSSTWKFAGRSVWL